MDGFYPKRSLAQVLPGAGAVLLLHAVLLVALVGGLNRVAVTRRPPAMIARIMDEVRPPPPPPPPVPLIAAAEPPVTAVTIPRIAMEPAWHSHTPPATLPGRAAAASGGASAPAGGAVRAEQPFRPEYIVAGQAAPAYPEAYEAEPRPGRVVVDCLIGIDGVPRHCRILSASGGGEFAAETLRWLGGTTHPVYRPAVRGGHAQAEEHQWLVTFKQPQ